MKSSGAWILPAVFVAMLVLGVGCSDDDHGEIFLPPPSPVKNLTQKGDVITNMELAYNQRKIDWYDGVLDSNFVFHLSPGDVGGGLPPTWDRAEEVFVNTRLFDKNSVVYPCQSIVLDIRSEDGISWTEVPAPALTGPRGHGGASSETWYKTTLHYDFKVEIYPSTYIPLPDSQLEIIVRDAGTPSKHHWQMVQLNDLAGASVTAASSRGTEAATLGTVKALYR